MFSYLSNIFMRWLFCCGITEFREAEIHLTAVALLPTNYMKYWFIYFSVQNSFTLKPILVKGKLLQTSSEIKFYLPRSKETCQKQSGQWGFIKYRPPKKNQISTKLFEISTTQHYIDQISTTKVPYKAGIYTIYFQVLR